MKTIFVSSTFKDMHFERDIIQESVLPAVNAEARRYGQSVSFCDLRWGISTEELESEEGSRKVLEVCLDEIDRCKPPMVVILGDRYGWIPPDDLIVSAASYKKLQLDHLKKSVTALEIEYGALTDARAADRTLFYFREISNDPPAGYGMEDKTHAALLSALKEKIRRLTNGKIRTYQVSWDEREQKFTGMDRFAQMLSEDLLGLLQPEWETAMRLTPHERERQAHRNFAEEKGRAFSARHTVSEQYLQKIREGEKLLIIKGEPGTGKSTLLCHLALVLEEEGYETLPLISGLTLKSSTAMDLIRQTVYEMECRLQLPHFREEGNSAMPDEKEWKKRCDELCMEYAAAGRHLVILLDAADQLLADRARENLLFIPDSLSAQVQFVMTCLTDFPTGGYSFSLLAPVDGQEKSDIIEGILASHGRELSSEVKKAIIRKKSSDYPLYLSMLIQRLIMMNRQDFDRIVQAGDGMDAISAYQKKIVEDCPDSVEDLSVELIRVAGERIGGAFAQTAAQYIAVSRYGLRPDDLSGLLGSQFRLLDFAHLVSYMSESFLLREDGRYDFAHRSIRAGFLRQCREPKELHRKLEAYFDTLPDGDEVKDREFTYHCIMAQDGARFAECVIRYNRRLEALAEHYEGEISPEQQAVWTLLSCAAKNLYTTSLVDHGTFLFPLMDAIEDWEEGRHFFWFLCNNYMECFENSAADSELLRRVREHALSLAERICRDGGETASARGVLAAACISLSHSCESGGKNSYQKTALLERAVLIWRELLSENPSDIQNRRELASALELLGSATEELAHKTKTEQGFFSSGEITDSQSEETASPEALPQKAIRQYEESMRLRREILQETKAAHDKIKLADICDTMASQYSGEVLSAEPKKEEPASFEMQVTRAKSQNRKAFSLYEQALALRREALSENPSEHMKKQLVFSCHEIADWYLKSGSPESAGESAKLYEEEISLLKEFAADSKTAAHYTVLAQACHDAGELHAYMRTAGELERAAALCEEAVTFQTQVVRMLGMPAMKIACAEYQVTLADIYIRQGSAEHLDRAEKLLQEAIAVLEESDHEKGSKTKFLASYAYRLYGDLLLQKNGRSGRKAARTWHKRSDRTSVIPKKSAYACAELTELIGYFEDDLQAMLPIKMTMFFHKASLATYRKHLDPSIPFDEQKLSRDTETLITILFSRYMADDEELAEVSDSIAENDAKTASPET